MGSFASRFCHINHLVIKTPRNLLVTPVLQPDVHLNDFPVSCPSFSASGRAEGNTTWVSDPLTSCPKAMRSLLIVSQPSCWDLISTYQKKPVKGNNQWAVSGWEVSSPCPLPESQVLNTPPCGSGLVGVLGPLFLLK